MSALSNYLENKLIDFLARGQSFTPPATWGVALVTAASTDASTGSTITEVTGGSYARVAVNPTTANWQNTQASGTGASSGTGGTTSNISDIVFGPASADWGTVVGVAICDSTSTAAGNALWYSSLTVNKVVSNGDSFTFAAGNLSLQIDN